MKNFISPVKCFLLLSLAALLLLSGCRSAEDEPEERISGFIKVLFTCPDEAQREILSVVEENVPPESNVVAEYQEYLSALLDPDDFTDKFFEGLAEQVLSSMVFPFFCVLEGYEISPGEVVVSINSESDKVYDYSVELTVKKGDTQQTVTESGKVQTDENGKISWLRPGLGELNAALGH